MNDSPITIKSLMLVSIGSLIITAVAFFIYSRQTATIIVFCDVGQGSATYMRIANQLDVVIDTGPDRRVLDCLGRYMPFYDRSIELILITHSDKDHYGGTSTIIDRYEVKQIIMNDLKKNSLSLQNLIIKLGSSKIPVKCLFSGDKVKLIDGIITFYWPPVDFRQKDGNETSSIFAYREGGFRLLFTGDSGPEVLNSLKYSDIRDTDILLVPHHGSKNGLTEKFLRLADPSVAVISAGKNNQFGHPHKSTLDLIDSKKINIRRTDEEGDIKFILRE